MCKIPDIRFKEGDSFKKYLQLFDRGQPIHWNGTMSVRMDVRDALGNLQTSFTFGNEITVHPTNDTLLIITKLPGLNEVTPREHQYDFKFTASDTVVAHSCIGRYICLPSITK